MDLISTTSDEDIRDNLNEEAITAEQKATELIRDLNSNDDSCLKNLIAMTGEESKKISLSSIMPFVKEYINSQMENLKDIHLINKYKFL